MTDAPDLSRLSGVPQTLLLPLWYRALDARQSVPLLGDPAAERIWQELACDERLVEGAAHDRVLIMLRAREFDRRARLFLEAHPDATIIDAGCGLDTRFERLAAPDSRWYDVDVPEVIDLRRRLLDETGRRRFIGRSLLDPAWMDLVDVGGSGAVLVLAEGVLMYFDEGQARALVCGLTARFPGAELVCDVFSRFFVRLTPWLHPALRRMGALPRWGVQRSSDPEAWNSGIRLVDEWSYFHQPEPRLGAMRLLKWVRPISTGSRILHLRLGVAPGNQEGDNRTNASNSPGQLRSARSMRRCSGNG